MTNPTRDYKALALETLSRAEYVDGDSMREHHLAKANIYALIAIADNVRHIADLLADNQKT